MNRCITPYYVEMPFVHCGYALIIMNMASFHFYTRACNNRKVMSMTFYLFYITGKIMIMTFKIRILAGYTSVFVLMFKDSICNPIKFMEM